jgi:hypothetical protein
MSTTLGSTGTGSSDEVGSEAAERAIRSNPAVIAFARVGWVAKGIVYGLVGILALAIVFGSQGNGGSGSGSGGSAQEASQSGALARIAESPAGTALLYVLAGGLVVYALWRLFTVIMPADNDAESWLTRGGYLVSAIVYSVLAWTAFTIAMSGGSSQQQSEDAKVERYTRDFLDMTGGRAIVFAAGAALIVIGAVFLYKAYSAKFEKQLEHRGVGPISYRMIVVLGRIGWVGRAGMMAVIGFFLCRAVWQFDPDEAKGLDGSLRQAAGSTGGTILVIVVGAGLVVYGAFCVISAPRRRLVPADES